MARCMIMFCLVHRNVGRTFVPSTLTHQERRELTICMH
jgi:hypothetical protein